MIARKSIRMAVVFVSIFVGVFSSKAQDVETLRNWGEGVLETLTNLLTEVQKAMPRSGGQGLSESQKEEYKKKIDEEMKKGFNIANTIRKKEGSGWRSLARRLGGGASIDAPHTRPTALVYRFANVFEYIGLRWQDYQSKAVRLRRKK